jgi:lipoate-protein ligase A
VDHRNDWTYALVLPRGHALEEMRATFSYRAVHEALAAVLQGLGVAAALKPAADPDKDTDEATATGVCFERAEIYDVVNANTGAKIAGAAQKRNKHGLLLQGSIGRAAVTVGPFDWSLFEDEFVGQLAAALGDEAVTAPWPEFDEDEVSGLTEQYASSEWIERR